MAELNPQDWAEVERLFRCAVELPPEGQADFLARECPNEYLRNEVASLLDHFGHGLPAADGAIQAAASALADGTDPDLRLIGARLGPYKLQAIVGHGGMGAVYRASREDAEFQQQVAIKLIRVAAESPAALRRFRQERQILAQLSHPNIARLLDGGSTPEGVPYLVMEFIDGERITDWCQEQSLSEAARLRLFLQVCEAVEFAHRQRVIHRDLKPANVLVTGDGTPKLLDFGIAKLLDPGAVGESATGTGLHLMTPDYASPEQVRGAPAAPSMDVYALGLILYQLLTGKKAQAVSDCTPEAMVTAICSAEPTAPAVVNPQLAGDLDTIIRMAIRKEPERRYASAAELARDIQRHLEGRPVVAHPDTLAYRSAKFLRRHRVSATVGALLIASMIVGLAIESWLRPRPPRVSQVVQLTQTGSVRVGLGMVTDGSRVYFTDRSLGRSSLGQVSVNGGIPQSITVTPSLSTPDIFDISPDHSQLLVTNAEGRDEALWIVPVRGGSARQLGDMRASAAAWSPDGKRIVFATRSALFRMNAAGTDSHKLADLPMEVAFGFLCWAPAGAPDVLRFGMVDPKTQVKSLWQIASDGTGLRPLVKGWRNGAGWPESDTSGSWFPSGSYFVFRSRRGKVSSIWALRDHRFLFPPFNVWPVQIYSSPLDFSALAPSPDGKRIFFVARQERREFVRYDARRGQFMPYLSGITGRFMDYSRDAQWAAY
ncbi:MAG: serine/threonine-protein kinase, partial [Acidobacteriaceae bacterium]|nr:serine/threonine-protein kinase [Acidobacteriaceae bacterium]